MSRGYLYSFEKFRKCFYEYKVCFGYLSSTFLSNKIASFCQTYYYALQNYLIFNGTKFDCYVLNNYENLMPFILKHTTVWITLSVLTEGYIYCYTLNFKMTVELQNHQQKSSIRVNFVTHDYVNPLYYSWTQNSLAKYCT